MPIFERGETRIAYEVTGTGPAVLLIAPGGMRSTAAAWERMPWNPRAALADRHTVVAMDQRNAGGSWAPIDGDTGWSTYTSDQVALMDHLGIDEFAVVGMCIGGPYIMGLAVTVPDRLTAAVMLQPIGLLTDDGYGANRAAFHEIFDGWHNEIEADHPEADEVAWAGYRANMYDVEPFLFSAGAEEVSSFPCPLLVARGNDLYHPAATSDEVARLAPDVTYVESWKEGDALAAAGPRFVHFLGSHS